MSRIAAVILAGGRGERLGGVDKSQIKVGGIRLIDRVTQALRGQVEAIICVRPVENAPPLPAGVVGISDLPTNFGGPLAGIGAAVDWLQRQAEQPEFLLSVAVDTPFFPENFAKEALELMHAGTGAVICRFDGQPYPTNGLWRVSSLGALPARILAGTAPKAPKFLLDELSVTWLDRFPQDGENPFANVNTLAELIILNQRAIKTGMKQ